MTNGESDTRQDEKLWIADTNFLYQHLEATVDSKNIVLMSTVRQEADKHKTAKDENLKYQAREINRFIFENYDKFHHDVGEYNPEEILGADYSKDIMDNRIVACAVENGYGILTGDLNLYSTAKAFGVEVENHNEDNSHEHEEYTGYKEVYMLPDEHQDFYTNKLAKNVYSLQVNQYLIILDGITGEPIDALKWDGEHHTVVDRDINLRSRKLGVFQPYDLYQSCAIDTVRSNKFSMLRGSAGVAKTQIAIAYAMQELQSSRDYSKIIVFSNSMPTKDAYFHGLVKGDLNTKLLDSSVGNILSSKLGNRSEVEAMLMTEELVILPASDIRGFDSSGSNAIIILSEAQNWSRELMKLAIQRLGEDCKLIVEGDNNTQLDSRSYEGFNNGMSAASEVFRGQPYYGEVKMKNIYRSKIAERAEMITESRVGLE